MDPVPHLIIVNGGDDIVILGAHAGGQPQGDVDHHPLGLVELMGVNADLAEHGHLPQDDFFAQAGAWPDLLTQHPIGDRQPTGHRP